MTRCSGGSDCSLDEEAELLAKQLQSPFQDELPPKSIMDKIQKMGIKAYLGTCNAHRFDGHKKDEQQFALYADINALYSCKFLIFISNSICIKKGIGLGFRVLGVKEF